MSAPHIHILCQHHCITTLACLTCITSFQFLVCLVISCVTIELQILGPDGMDLSFGGTDRRYWLHPLGGSAGGFVSSGVTECMKLFLDFRRLFTGS